MKLTAKDQAGMTVSYTADDNRIAQFNHYFATNPGMLGFGVGNNYGRPAARDATEAQAFSVSQLAFTESTTFARQYAPLTYEVLLPGVISTAAGEWAQTVEYNIMDGAGMGKRISYGSNDVPFADVAYSRKAIPVAYGGIAYQYNQEEIRTSAYLQRPLPEAKMQEAMIAYRRHINAVALVGETSSNFTGLFNTSGVTTVASSGVWSNTNGGTVILPDIMSAVQQIMVTTQNNSMPTKMAVPIAHYGYLMQPRTSTDSTTLLEYIKKIYPGIEIYPVFELASIGGATGRAVLYTPDEQNMVFHLPMPLRFLAPQNDVLRVVVPGEYKYAGLEWRRPLTGYYINLS